MRPVLPLLALACLLWSALLRAHDGDGVEAGHSQMGEAFDEGPRQAAYLMAGMPKIDFPITTPNPEAQRFFNQGIGQLHGFWYFEAERSFRQVAKLDPGNPMAAWGIAMANSSNEKRAREFAAHAATLAASADAKLSRREKLYLEALAKLHPGAAKVKDGKSEAPKAGSDADKNRHRDHVKALEQIIEEFPKDLEAKAFLVFKIWDNDQRFKISSHMAAEALAQQILAVNPLHPVQHARIHLWNHEADRRAIDAAGCSGQTSPGIAHMWHMSGHTYSELKRFADAAWQQEASARVDHAYMVRNRVLPDQIHNYAHNNEWLVRTLNHLGRVSEAVDLAKNMVELPRHPKFNSLSKATGKNAPSALSDSTDDANQKRSNSASFGRARLVDTLVTWELWDDLLALGDTHLEPTDLTDEQIRRLKALGTACFAKGDVEKGNVHLAELRDKLLKLKTQSDTDAAAAETKAREEKKNDKEIAEAGKKARESVKKDSDNLTKAIAELHLFELLAKDDLEAAQLVLDEVKGLSKERLSRIWLKLGDKEKAVKLAQEAADAAKEEVPELANLVDILNSAGKDEDAAKNFQKLRQLAAQADPDLPVFRRLEPLARRLNLHGDWRLPFVPATNTAPRPALDSLGPFRWHPSPAPDWNLTASDGTTISLKDFRGKPVLVIFYLGAGCSHCLEQLNTFAPFHARYQEAGIPIVAVSTDTVSGLKDTIAQSKESGGFPFPIVSNEAMDAFRAYRAFDDYENTALHGTFLLDAEGLVRWQDIGYEPFTEAEFLLNEAQRLLKLPAQTAHASAR